MSRIIAISGYARSGKDTIYELLEEFVEVPYGANFRRLAFADELKKDMSYFIEQSFNVDVWNPSDADKKIIRPIMVEYGKAKRKLDDLHWVGEVTNQLNPKSTDIYVVTDVRYENEVKELRRFTKENDMPFFHFHVERDGVGAANQEEETTITPLKGIADFSMVWKSFDEVCDTSNEEELKNTKKEYASYIIEAIEG